MSEVVQTFSGECFFIDAEICFICNAFFCFFSNGDVEGNRRICVEKRIIG